MLYIDFAEINQISCRSERNNSRHTSHAIPGTCLTYLSNVSSHKNTNWPSEWETVDRAYRIRHWPRISGNHNLAARSLATRGTLSVSPYRKFLSGGQVYLLRKLDVQTCLKYFSASLLVIKFYCGIVWDEIFTLLILLYDDYWVEVESHFRYIHQSL